MRFGWENHFCLRWISCRTQILVKLRNVGKQLVWWKRRAYVNLETRFQPHQGSCFADERSTAFLFLRIFYPFIRRVKKPKSNDKSTFLYCQPLFDCRKMLHNQRETDLLLHLDATVVTSSGHDYEGTVLLTRDTLFIVGSAVDAIQQTLCIRDTDLQEDEEDSRSVSIVNQSVITKGERRRGSRGAWQWWLRPLEAVSQRCAGSSIGANASPGYSWRGFDTRWSKVCIASWPNVTEDSCATVPRC